MSNLSRVNDAHKRREAFLEIHGRSRLVEIRLLHEIWKNKDYEKLGFDSFKAYFEGPRDSGGLDISRSWAMELIHTFEKYVKQLGQPDTIFLDHSPRKLYYLKEEANKDNIEDILSKAKTLPLKDLMLEKQGINEMDCEHRFETWRRCAKCKVWEKVAEQHGKK